MVGLGRLTHSKTFGPATAVKLSQTQVKAFALSFPPETHTEMTEVLCGVHQACLGLKDGEKQGNEILLRAREKLDALRRVKVSRKRRRSETEANSEGIEEDEEMIDREESAEAEERG